MAERRKGFGASGLRGFGEPLGEQSIGLCFRAGRLELHEGNQVHRLLRLASIPCVRLARLQLQPVAAEDHEALAQRRVQAARGLRNKGQGLRER